LNFSIGTNKVIINFSLYVLCDDYNLLSSFQDQPLRSNWEFLLLLGKHLFADCYHMFSYASFKATP